MTGYQDGDLTFPVETQNKLPHFYDSLRVQAVRIYRHMYLWLEIDFIQVYRETYYGTGIGDKHGILFNSRKIKQTLPFFFPTSSKPTTSRSSRIPSKEGIPRI